MRLRRVSGKMIMIPPRILMKTKRAWSDNIKHNEYHGYIYIYIFDTCQWLTTLCYEAPEQIRKT